MAPLSSNRPRRHADQYGEHNPAAKHRCHQPPAETPHRQRMAHFLPWRRKSACTRTPSSSVENNATSSGVPPFRSAALTSAPAARSNPPRPRAAAPHHSHPVEASAGIGTATLPHPPTVLPPLDTKDATGGPPPHNAPGSDDAASAALDTLPTMTAQNSRIRSIASSSFLSWKTKNQCIRLSSSSSGRTNSPVASRHLCLLR